MELMTHGDLKSFLRSLRPDAEVKRLQQWITHGVPCTVSVLFFSVCLCWIELVVCWVCSSSHTDVLHAYGCVLVLYPIYSFFFSLLHFICWNGQVVACCCCSLHISDRSFLHMYKQLFLYIKGHQEQGYWTIRNSRSNINTLVLFCYHLLTEHTVVLLSKLSPPTQKYRTVTDISQICCFLLWNLYFFTSTRWVIRWLMVWFSVDILV